MIGVEHGGNTPLGHDEPEPIYKWVTVWRIEMNTEKSEVMQGVNETIDSFFSTNKEIPDKYTIYLDRNNLDEDVNVIKMAFKNLPGVVDINVNTEESSIEILTKRNESVYIDMLKDRGYPVIATEHNEDFD